MDYHGKIINLPRAKSYAVDSYACGHKDARHAAAEIVLEAQARIKTLEAENAALREALVRIANRPSQMVWGEEGEVRVAIREMEEIAGAALARQTEGEG